MEDIEEGVEGYDDEKSLLMSQKNLEKRFGQSPVVIAATFMEQGGIPPTTNPATLLKEAIHVISCGYEDKSEWGKEIGWIYGSVTEDILTGFKMHARGWISVYCVPPRPAFKGSAPINLSDRLNQVLRWALGSIEILLSRHCPICELQLATRPQQDQQFMLNSSCSSQQIMLNSSCSSHQFMLNSSCSS
ncbi:hypothetical protein POM88_013474 [Heracleum sosnowskyi]|uniref:Cellulose synthase n=1 Tax=Heracleum sosnowskyi TaxID=360622 RepID=A0AAD8IZY5_9APIA|nr:hypothetical protein POM88_013474 [Heracleum sosnowskyi]